MSDASYSTTRLHPFERSIEILIVEDVFAECDVYDGFLSSYGPYNVTCVTTAKEAEALLLSPKRFHACLTDLGICDMGGDEYYLLKKFSTRLPFVVVTGNDSLKQGFEIRKFGAFAALKKPIDFQSLDLIRVINEAVLHGIFHHGISGNFKRVILDAVDVFMEVQPRSLREWSEAVGVDERHFRRVWTECFGFSPRMIFVLYHQVLEAFEHYSLEYCKKFNLPQASSFAQLPNKKSRIVHHHPVFQRYQKEMMAMLRGGIVKTEKFVGAFN